MKICNRPSAPDLSPCFFPFASCSKENTPILPNKKLKGSFMTILLPAELVYYIMVDGSKEKVIPVNLPVGFRVP